MRNNLLLALSALCVLLCCTAPASAFSYLRKRESKKERAAEAKKPGKYEKLFEKGVEKRASGAFATLHKVNGKLYLEFPLELLGREMLLSSATVQTSDSRFCIRKRIVSSNQLFLGRKVMPLPTSMLGMLRSCSISS